MLHVFKPSSKKMPSLLEKWRKNSLNYKDVGGTKNSKMPYGYDHHLYRIQLGEGKETFERAKWAIENWKMYDLRWMKVHDDKVPIEEGQVSVTFLKICGIWFSANPCRIVYTVDETNDDVTTFGFAFGTVKDHPESGEELFTVEWNRKDDSVWYQVKAFSQPSFLVVWIGYPVVLYLQHKFFRDTQKAMLSFAKG